MEKKKYEYLNNLGKKLSKFVSDEFILHIQQNDKSIKELVRTIKENKNKEKEYQDRLASMKAKGMDDITYVYEKLKEEYDDFKVEKEKLENQYTHLISKYFNELKDTYKFDKEKFYVFLQNVLKISINDIKLLFNNNLDDDLHLLIEGIVSDYGKDFPKKIEKLSEIEIIQNRYNANVNCFNTTGDYIQNYEYSYFLVLNPEIFRFATYAEMAGLLKSSDIYSFKKITSVDKCNDVYTEDEADFTPEEYAYAIFYENPVDLDKKLDKTFYIWETFEEPDFDRLELKVDMFNKINFDRNNEEVFREVVDSIAEFMKNEIKELDDYYLTDEEKTNQEKKINDFINKMNEKYSKKTFVDSEANTLSNNADDLGGMGSV